ncbi:AAA family ATPase [Clostridium paraputrificum]|uniref:AAA family ATPase n=1 Tax=Clostridium TaxID=1485 RepID=UPI001896E2E6|nr:MULTISPECIES: AAA family ATPase [Clostridium]MDB2104740.1 AAA family ATPase [Clostridium paraputrificum]MDC0803339.1 AAA family ATPase [Clostridium paraputrificum]MDU1937828.1 AAA family ATPase [Clostridium sp.]MDU2046283.1 AAA family ATPase [Clostridium sp.]
MKEISLVLYDQDYLYVKEVINFFNSNYRSHFKVIGVTSKIELEKLIYSGRTIDILLINEELAINFREINMIKIVIMLSENERNNDIDNKQIFKYQNGHAVCNCIKKIYTSVNPQVSFNDSKVMRFVTFFSPIGGVGKTLLSILFSIRLTKEGKKVLLINLEQVSALGIYFDVSDRNNTITDLLYKAADGVEIDKNVLDSVVKKDENTNVYYINPIISTIDIEDGTCNNLIYVLNAIKKETNFDYVVIDSGSRLDNSIKRLGEYSDKLIGIIESSHISLVKMSKMLDEFINDDNIILLINKYNLNKDISLFEEYENIKEKIYSYITYDSYLDNNKCNLSTLLNADTINTKVNDFIYKLMREEWRNE